METTRGNSASGTGKREHPRGWTVTRHWNHRLGRDYLGSMNNTAPYTRFILGVEDRIANALIEQDYEPLNGIELRTTRRLWGPTRLLEYRLGRAGVEVRGEDEQHWLGITTRPPSPRSGPLKERLEIRRDPRPVIEHVVAHEYGHLIHFQRSGWSPGSLLWLEPDEQYPALVCAELMAELFVWQMRDAGAITWHPIVGRDYELAIPYDHLWDQSKTAHSAAFCLARYLHQAGHMEAILNRFPVLQRDYPMGEWRNCLEQAYMECSSGKNLQADCLEWAMKTILETTREQREEEAQHPYRTAYRRTVKASKRHAKRQVKKLIPRPGLLVAQRVLYGAGNHPWGVK